MFSDFIPEKHRRPTFLCYPAIERSQLMLTESKRRKTIKNTPVRFITKTPGAHLKATTPSPFFRLPPRPGLKNKSSPFSSNYRSRKQMRASLYKYGASCVRIYSDRDPIRIVNKSDKTETDLLRHAITSRVYDGAEGKIGLWKDLIKTGRRLQQVGPARATRIHRE